MKTTLLPFLILPAIAAAHQSTPVQTPAPKTPVTPPAPASNQTPPIMPNLAPIPLPVKISIPGGPPNDGDRPLTAAEAARLALRVQPSLRLAEADLLAAEGRLQVAKSGLLPTLTLSATYGREIVVSHGVFSFPTAGSSSSSSGTSGTTTTTTTGVFSGLGSTLALKQLLFDFGHTRNLVRQADAEAGAAKQGLTLAQLNLVYAVKQSFYTYVEDLALVAVEQANVANTKQELDLATAQVKTGLGEPANVVTAASAYGAASQALSQAEQTALIARINLAVAIGVDPRTPINPSQSEEPPPSNQDVNALVGQAIKQRPDILQAIQTLHAAGYELSAARTTTAPSLNLTLEGTASGEDEPFSKPGGAAGLSVSWEIFDGGATAGSIKVARADVITAQSQLQTATQTAISDVTQAYVNLKTAEQQVAITEASEKNAEEGVRLAEGRYKAGVAIFIEVTTAQATLVQAQTALVTAQVAIQQARAQLHRAIGLQ
jgi:outer membrane protein